MTTECPICDSVMHLTRGVMGGSYVCRRCGFRQVIGSPNAFFQAKQPRNDFERWYAQQKGGVSA